MLRTALVKRCTLTAGSQSITCSSGLLSSSANVFNDTGILFNDDLKLIYQELYYLQWLREM
jgi:hypothetical protein